MHVYLCIPAMPTRLWVYAPLLCTPHGPAASLSTAPSPNPNRAHLLEHGVERGHGLHLPYTSPTPPLHLPYISPASPVYRTSLSTASSAGTAGFMKSVWKAPATASGTAMRALKSGLAISTTFATAPLAPEHA